MSEVKTRSAITLKGSSQMVKEYFNYGINSILYQRGIYPSEMFKKEKRYNMYLFISENKELNAFLAPLMAQIQDLLEKQRLKRLVVLIIDVEKNETLERWQFDVACESDVKEGSSVMGDEKRIKQEISDVLRQTHKDVKLNSDWADTTAGLIKDAEEVQLRPFSTKLHNIQTKVQYKADC